MLSLSVKVLDVIVVDGGRLLLRVTRVRGGKVTLSFDAGPDVRIDRLAVHERRIAARGPPAVV